MNDDQSKRPPFAMIPNPVIDAELSAKALALYVHLVKYAGKDGRAYPARLTLARNIGLKKADSVDGPLDELEAAGFIIVKRRWTNPQGDISFKESDDCKIRTSSIYEVVAIM